MSFAPRHGLLCTLIALAACSNGSAPYFYLGPPGTSPTHVVITVQQGAAGETWRFRSVARNGGRTSETKLPEQKPESAIKYPATYALIAEDWTGPTELELEALDKDEQVIGRARGTVVLQRQQGISTELTLGKPCTASGQCANGIFCDGEEACESGICVAGPPACQSAFECTVLTCLESAGRCAVQVNHAACPPENDDGGQILRYCDPAAGCVRGQPCTTDDECQDDSVCNGREVCVGSRCVAGPTPRIDDNNPCTTDACAEPNGAVYLNVADGNACTRMDMTAGICLRGTCEISTCGDGFKDRDEECDDGTMNSDTIANRCRTDCKRPFCGDSVTDLGEDCDDGNMLNTDACLNTCVDNECGDSFVNMGVEQCDDGNDLDTDACKRSCENNVCGDGIRNPGAEACDDGNMNPNDGCHMCGKTSWEPQVVLGFGQSGGDPLNLALTYPEGLVADRLGNLYFTEYGGRIWRVDAAAGGLTRVAGVASAGFGGDNGPATSAALSEPQGIVLDERGNLYFADAANNSIRRIDRQGVITTLAGDGNPGFTGDGQPATRAQLNYPTGIARDRFGNLIIADSYNNRVRRIGTNGRITTIAGDGAPESDGDGGPAINASLNGPWGVLIDDDGSILVSERQGNRIRRIAVNGTITAVAGDGNEGSRNGPALQAQFHEPAGMARLPDGSLLIADQLNHQVRRLTPAGDVEVFAGTGEIGSDGDGGPAIDATFNQPVWLIADETGVVTIADEFNQRVRRVGLDGNVTTIAGLEGPLYGGFGTAARDAFMIGPNGVAVGSDGSIYVAEYEGHRVRRIFTTGAIVNYVGNGQPGDTGDNGPASDALLAFPDSLAMDAQGNLFITDSGNSRIRKVSPSGTITTIAGTGVAGFSGDGMLATMAEINGPSGIAIDTAGNIFFSDALNYRIRRIDTMGIITTIAGDGTDQYTGDGGQARMAGISHVYGIALDGMNNLYMADDVVHRVRRVNLATGVITTVAGNGMGQSSGDGLLAVNASLSQPGAVLADTMGNLFIADTYGNRIRKVAPNGIISTVVGNGDGAFFGDFGPAVQGSISRPYQLGFDLDGSLLITDYGNGLLRAVSPAGVITTRAGSAHPGDGPFSVAQLTDPRALVVNGTSILVADGQGGRVRNADTAAMLLKTVTGYPRAPVMAAQVAATTAPLIDDAAGIAYDAMRRHLYVSERSAHRILRLVLSDPASPETWTREVFAGVDDENTPHRDGTVASARFNLPSGLAFDAAARILYVVEAGNHDVRAITVDTPTSAMAVTTVAGLPGVQGFFGENVVATGALLDSPEAIVLSSRGDLFIADTANHRVRRVDAMTRRISTVIGDGTPAASGAGSPALFFTVDTPRGLSLDAFGNLFITSRYALRLVTAGDDGIASGDDEVLTLYGTTPRDEFPESVTQCLTAIHVETGDGTLLMTDSCQGFLLRLTRTIAP